MADAVGLTSAIVSLVTNAYSTCQKLYSTFDGLRNAPKHIATISNDLEDFYLVLGTLQALLDDEEFSAGILQHAQTGNLCNVLRNSVLVFKDLNIIVSEYQVQTVHSRLSGIGPWERLKWTFKETEIRNLRLDLMGCKATLNMAISVANLYNTRAPNNAITRLEEDMAAHLQELEKLPDILRQMEDLGATHLSQAFPHHAIDRAGIKVDYNYAIRHYTDSAASIYSGLETPSAPSLQISAFETTFYTVPMSWHNNNDNGQETRACTQIFVRDVGLYKTIVLQVDPAYTIHRIKSLILERIGVENAEFDLLYSSRILRSEAEERSIAECNITHNATLTCISFRLKHSLLAENEKGYSVLVETFGGKSFDILVGKDTSIREVKEMSIKVLGAGLDVEKISLIFAGMPLADDCSLDLCKIGPGDTLRLFDAAEDNDNRAEVNPKKSLNRAAGKTRMSDKKSHRFGGFLFGLSRVPQG